MPACFLHHRRLIQLKGRDGEHFLQNLITTDVADLALGEARPGALLTPQGKILFDFVIWRDGESFLLETDSHLVAPLLQRLSLYKLRAAVEIAASDEDGVTVVWDAPGLTQGIADIRFAKAGVSLIRHPGLVEGAPADGDYDALRIAAGVAASGQDFPLQDAFPHDVLLDLNGGLSFRKGCYVGQEVVSRMQHRGTARRRLVHVEADQELPETRSEITANGKAVGTIGTRRGKAALAIVRLDRVGAAIAAGVPLLAGDVAVTAMPFAWTGLTFPTEEAAEP